ncbi:antirestriction protein [Aquimarina sp. BL5]|uniref:antirestriction protein n=1 Tax=Aquimarina sp. BL5 TaxID=1714860 RepID=UPI000E4BD765|nr:antirestriction protein [Aquimarina sp. BL5]AXT51351.1 antirestriction protein [Aquimarina sp. BL5]RKN09859.1 antirestriction protein [Aquimarina sp. BL5]
MEKPVISFENYNDAILQVSIKSLPKILQKGHQFFIEAKDFYHQEPEIKETIDIYLKQLNAYLSVQENLIKNNASISFIRTFLDMHSTIKSKNELKSFIYALQKAVSKKEITKNDPYAMHIDKLQHKLIKQHNEMILQEQVKIIINRKWRSELKTIVNQNPTVGLSGIEYMVSKENKNIPITDTKNNILFTSFDQQPLTSTTPTFRLPGAMGELLGDLEKFELAITIEGDQGGGKTRFTYQLADAFAEMGNNVAIFTLEIGGKSDLITRMKNEYLSPQNRNRISRADRLPNGYNTITSAVGTFDVIIIDSWNKTGLPSQDFDRLRKQYPDTIFIVIFQRTTQKTIRGGTAPLYDAGINIEVIKVDDTFQNNYAVTSKNRYGITGIKYNISTKQIIGAAETNPELEEQPQKAMV